MKRRLHHSPFPWYFLVFILCLFFAGGARAAKRVALVVGNSDYEHGGKLPNAVNDAEDMAALLRGLKGKDGKALFDGVRLQTNRKRSELMEDLAALGADGEKGGLVMFFYAGHGLVIDGENYLQPVDAELVPGDAGKKLSKVRCIKVRDALGLLEGGADGGLTLALLDCCRNNPFEVKRSGGANPALRKMGSSEIPEGQLVVFATSKEDVADDGAGRNSPFTTALKQHLPTPGLEALTLMRRVVGDVKESTFAVQRPEITFSYENEFVLVPGDSLPPEPAPEEGGSFAGSRAGELWNDGMLGTRMRWCPPGNFLMGSPSEEVGRSSDETRHGVRISKGFFMGELEVTQGEWKVVMGRTQSAQVDLMLADKTLFIFGRESKTLATFYNGLGYDGTTLKNFESSGRHPIYFVSWNEAREFCEKLTVLDRKSGKIPESWAYRLPTEAEWEYACRAGTDGAIYDGELKLLGKNNAPALDGISWYSGNSSEGYAKDKGIPATWSAKQYYGGKAGPRQTGEKRANAWGLKDMIGNLREWCGDGYGSYPAGDLQVDPFVKGGSLKVVRGGCWYFFASNCRSAKRLSAPPANRTFNLGFRVVLAPGAE